jgi:hypothetical protein
MRRILVSTVLTAAALCAGDAALASEPFRDGSKDIRVTSDKDMPFPFKAPEGLSRTELWFQGHDGAKWGAWQKHAQVFAKDTPVVWAPPEGRWQIYLRPILTSELAGADPAKNPEQVKPQKEFIIDRSAPQVAVTFPGAKAKLRGGDKYTVTWTAADPYLRNAPITIKWSLDGSGTFTAVANDLPNSGSFEWTVPRDMTSTGVLRVEVGDKAGNVGMAESTGILVDSIRPKGRVTGPSISAKTETALDLDVADTGPAGLTAARLWVSQDDGTSWTEGPSIEAPFKTVTWKAPQDGRFRLYVVATDAAGNVSTPPQGKVGDILAVDTAAPTVLLAAAIGISESATAGPGSRRDFKPGDRVQVVFTAKDANLVANSISVLWQSDASKPWVELGKGLPVEQAFRFQIPADAPETKSARVKVTAVDAAGNVGEVVASESYTIQTQVVQITLE